jgi:shikimate kinase
MKTNIALIGFMATGKTAVGRLLAERTGKNFIELDSLIAHRADKSIEDIFTEDGEATFRKLEIALVKEIADNKNQVIACGGGVVLNQINIDRLKKNASIILLEAKPEVILKRSLYDKAVRPLLKGDDKKAKIKELLSFRQPLYKRAADITIDTSDMDIGLITDKIIKLLEA